MSSSSFAVALRRLGRWALVALLFAGTLEAAARLDDAVTFGAPLWSRYDADLLRGLDAAGVPRNVAGARFQKWRINSMGFRGDEIALEKAAGRRRVICLGQSESFGLYEQEGGEWPARLQRLLRTAHPEVEVLNASVVGAGRRKRQAYLERYVLPLRPDVVVLYFNSFNEATEALRAVGELEDAPGRGGGPSQDRGPHLRVAEKLKLRMHDLLPAALDAALRLRLLERRVQAAEAALGARRPIDALAPVGVANAEGHLRDMVQFLRAHGVRPVLVTYPTLANRENRGRYRQQLLGERFYRAWFSEAGLLEAARQIDDATRRVAAELSVPLVDLAKAIPATSEYFADDVHYTDRGAERVAARVAEGVERDGLLR